jgi:hypothetical protein
MHVAFRVRVLAMSEPPGSPDPLLIAALARFSQPVESWMEPPLLPHAHPTSLKPAPSLPSARTASSDCTKSGHPPVDALHSIENTHLTNAGF